jgi:hypothetical protein
LNDKGCTALAYVNNPDFKGKRKHEKGEKKEVSFVEKRCSGFHG